MGRHAAGRHIRPRSRSRSRARALGIGVASVVSVTSGAALGWAGPALPALDWASPVMASGPTTGPPRILDDAARGSNPAVTPNAAAAGLTPEPEATEPFEPRTITILGVGDILVHREILDQALKDGEGEVDFLPQLEGIRPLVESVDLAVCHMEYPLGSVDGPWSVWPEPVNAPPQLAAAIADLGFDACSTASNHSLAQGFDGVTSTIDALRAVGLAHAGTAISEAEAERITMLDVEGVPVALLSYTYGFNGIPRPYDWCCEQIDNELIVADAQRARAQGARIVVVSLHQGVEGVVLPTYEQRVTIEHLAASGAVDLVLGHHAHVVQPVTKVGDMWVAYGHGNLLSAQSRRDPRTGDGLLTVFTFQERPDGGFDAMPATGYPLVNEDFPFRVYPVGDPESSSARAEATWQRVSQQARMLDDPSAFSLVR